MVYAYTCTKCRLPPLKVNNIPISRGYMFFLDIIRNTDHVVRITDHVVRITDSSDPSSPLVVRITDYLFCFSRQKMQHGDEEDADTQDTQDPLAALIIEKQRNNVTKGTQQVYDC